MKKTVVRIKGGLGNQLFCYAAARRLALVNRAELVIDDVTGFARDRRYRRRYALDRFRISARKAAPRERMEPFERYRRGLAKFLAKRRPFHRRRYVEQEGIDFDERLLTYRVRGTVYLDGLWQSEGYFKDVEDTIRKDLQISPPVDRLNQGMATRIAACNAVAVHVRWFEGPETADCPHNIGSSYYTAAIQEIRDKVTKPYFFLFSDKPEAAMQTLDLPEDAATCVSHNKGDENAYADLWLMSQCKHFIIANSTFSWWGAWLSPHHDKIVIAPAMKVTGMTGWGFQGLLPSDWSQIPVGPIRSSDHAA